MRYYLGIPQREVFRAKDSPTPQSHPEYGAVVGPFRTKRAAKFMAECGINNPHCVTVADAERLARERG